MAIARGDLDHKIEVHEGDEIGELAAAFADMTEAIKEVRRRRAELHEELEAKVEQRTDELVAINTQLEKTISELRETQTQLILSERLAGLGLLVAGVAHEVNSPSAAIRPSSWMSRSQNGAPPRVILKPLWSGGLCDPVIITPAFAAKILVAK